MIDVYRGRAGGFTSYVDYALFVAFFPQLVAGPIVRAREFFHDYGTGFARLAQEWQRGLALILTGSVKKLIFADRSRWWPTVFHESRGAAGFLSRVDRRPSHSRCRSFSISPATRISRSASPCCSASTSRKISAGHIFGEHHASSGAAGT